MGLTFFAKCREISLTQVMGDSREIVDWALDLHTIHSISLSHWPRRVRRLMDFSPFLTYSHIYREFNSLADDMSKKAIGIGT